ncbi:lytic transglycosylase domain-containing protein [Streptomyces qinglanensis]|uniref:lytic transglycosylase domain-containing protein n=1 Tax=Streptomyces qinglanensis TaxID=943816 RepID=UPI003D709F0D
MTQQEGTRARARRGGSHTAAVARSAPARPGGGRRVRLRRRAAGTALAALAVAALTASQAPGAVGPPQAREPWKPVRTGTPYPEGAADDGSYHVELPPLAGSDGIRSARTPGLRARAAAESGIPVTVLRAYRNAEKRLRSQDPGCGLRWELLAALGKVESGQARGGDLRSDGTTRKPILGPVLDGAGFARITDTDGGAWDGDTRFDRAVGPMQFIPGTWRSWGADGNGDGRKDPHNIHDAALAAGRYLCAGDRDLTSPAQLRAAILSYNHSGTYLRTVLAWFDFYRKGTHAVPDGEGVLPTSPGAGGAGKTKNKSGKSSSKEREKGKEGEKEKGGGTSGGGAPGSGSTGGGGGAEPGGGPSPRPTGSATGSPDPDGSGTPGGGSGESPGCPQGSGSPTPGPTNSPSPSSTPAPTGSDAPCESGEGG